MTEARLTKYTTNKGVMAKTFSVNKEGKIIKKYPGKISKGTYTVHTLTMEKLQIALADIPSDRCIGLGTPDREKGNITWLAKHRQMGCPDDPIPRNLLYFKFRAEPAFMLLDIDGIKKDIKDVLRIIGEIVPGFNEAKKLVIPSSSAGIMLDGKLVRDSTSAHVYVMVEKGEDIPRFIDNLFKFLWIRGYGHIELSADGKANPRSIIDRFVASPERIVYEAPPVLEGGLTQEREESYIIDGGILDTSALEDLKPPDYLQFWEQQDKAKREIIPQQEIIQAQYIDTQSDKLVKHNKDLTKDQAVAVIKSRQNAILHDDDILSFADHGTLSVGEVLDNGTKYDNASLADPAEPDYDGGSLNKAKFYWNDGAPQIHSFAHGSSKYRFKRYLEPDKWLFNEAEKILLSVDWTVACSESKIDLANEILRHNNFDKLEFSFIRNHIKKYLGIDKGVQDQVISGANASGLTSGNDDDSMTHWEIANMYITKFLPDHPEAVSAEGALWTYDSDTGLYDKYPLTKVENMIGMTYPDKNCKKGSDYKAIARIVNNQLLDEEYFSSAPYGIAVQSGFIRISDDGEVENEPYTPDHRQRYKMPFDPVQKEAPMFTQYLEDTFDGDERDQQILLLQEIMGGIVTGCFSKLQRAVLLKGPGSNGKSVLLELLENMFPQGLKSAIPPEKFTEEYYRAKLAGKIINIVGELDKTKSLHAVFKDIIGCDTPLVARLPYKEPFNFKPSAAHIFASNHYPQTKDHTHGFYRRWVIIDFENTVTDDKKIPNLGSKIAADELPQVLEWSLQGAKRLVKNNFVLSLTNSHEKSLEHWKNTKDSVWSFLNDDETVIRDPNTRTPKKVVYAAYRTWCNDMGVMAVGYQEFCERCRAKYSEGKRTNEKRCFDGLKLVGNTDYTHPTF